MATRSAYDNVFTYNNTVLWIFRVVRLSSRTCKFIFSKQCSGFPVIFVAFFDLTDRLSLTLKQIIGFGRCPQLTKLLFFSNVASITITVSPSAIKMQQYTGHTPALDWQLFAEMQEIIHEILRAIHGTTLYTKKPR